MPDHVLYVGTADGVYVGEERGDAFEARALGLQGKGSIRNPVLVDRDDPDRLYVGTSREGVQASDDGGETWRGLNRGIVYREVWSVVQNRRSGDLYAGTGPATIYRSTDRGETWTDCEQLKRLPESIDWSFPQPPHIAHVKNMDVCAEDGERVMAALEEGWLVKSVDGGQTWRTIKQGTHFDSHSVVTMPDDPRIVMSTSGRGAFRSEDGGETFEPASQGLDCIYMAQIVVHPKRPSVLYTAAAEVPPPGWRTRPEGANAGFFRSEDQGRSWRRLKGGLPATLKGGPRATSGDPEDPDTFFVGLTDGSVWMSEDGGESFRQILSGLPEVSSLKVVRR
jgi:photosystem II stability/assembly factor-like uncharacterized protein